jgi:hypothetical protein
MLRAFCASSTTKCARCKRRAPTMRCEKDERICRTCHAAAMAAWRIEDAADEAFELTLDDIAHTHHVPRAA